MSEQKKPRIASVSVGLGDAPQVEEQERPQMRIVIVAAAAASGDHGLASGSGLVRVGKEIDEALAEIGSKLVVDLPIRGGGVVRSEIAVDGLRTYRPVGLVEKVPVLGALVQARRAILADGEEAREARAKAMRLAPEEIRPMLSQLLDGGPSQSSAAPAASKGGSALDDLFDKVGFSSDDVAKAPSAVAAFARAQGPAQTIDPGRTNAVDGQIVDFLSRLLENPELRRLERLWSSIRLLRESAGDEVVIDLVVASPDQQAEALAALADDQEAGGDRIDLIVLDQVVGTSNTDVARIEACAEQAARMLVPVIASTVPSVIGAADLAAIDSAQRRLGSPDDPKTVAFRAFTSRDPSQWVALAANGPQVRGPWEIAASVLAGLKLESTGESSYALPAFALGALCATAFGRVGWPAPHVGPRHGILAGAAPEHPISIDAQKNAARAGITVFGGPRDGDSTVLSFAPMAFRGAAIAKGGDPSAPLTLADQLLIGRVASALQALGASIPKGTDPEAVQEVALVALASLFPEGDRPKLAVACDGSRIHVKLDGSGWHDVQLGEITLAAALG